MKDKLWLKAMNFCTPTCHQRVDRSYFIGNYQLPVCARCQGVYIGYLVGLFIYIPLLALLLPLTYIDGFIQLKTKYTSTNPVRLITGVISGIATIQIFKVVIHTIF